MGCLRRNIYVTRGSRRDHCRIVSQHDGVDRFGGESHL
jgi:hypothetical protein